MSKGNSITARQRTEVMRRVSDQSRSQSAVRVFKVAFVVVAALQALFFCVFTGNIWEDFFITFRPSQNVCHGLGLIYQEGETVHSFTSPLGTLLPALCYALSARHSYLAALWLFRVLFCIPAYCAAGYLLIRLFERKTEGAVLPLSIGLLYLVEVKSLMFSVNGMETALMLFFLAWSFYLSQVEIKRKWLLSGLAWGGLMWTRPDGCVYIALLGVMSTIFAQKTRREVVITHLKATLVTTAVYLPWFLFTFLYYGSPIPHPLTAKQELPSGLLFGISWIFGPIYPYFGSWPPAILNFSGIVAIFGCVYWMLPLQDRLGRSASFMFFCLAIYFRLIPFAYPWYFPPAAMLGLVAIVSGGAHLCRWLNRSHWQRIHLFAMATSFIFMVSLYALTLRQVKLQQELVENGVRRQVGLWLKENTEDGDRIYLEPLGYIGYFSEGKMLDYPGLASDVVLQSLKRGNDQFTAILDLKPEWCVLRPLELSRFQSEPYYMHYFEFQRLYNKAKTFSATEQVRATPSVPGRAYLIYDSEFLIFKRNDS